jgi:hypothetical protein
MGGQMTIAEDKIKKDVGDVLMVKGNQRELR